VGGAVKLDVGRGVHHAQMEYWRLKRTMALAGRELPSEWLPSIAAQAETPVQLVHVVPRPGDIAYKKEQKTLSYKARAPNNIDRRGVWDAWLYEFGGAVGADLTDSDIKAQAEKFASEAQALDMGRMLAVDAGGAWGEYARLLAFCEARMVQAPPVALLLSGMAARVCCRYWWRRALRRMVARRCERGALSLGLVCKQRGQSYASNKAVFRRLDQNKRNAQALEATALENEDGQRATLAELAARSVSSKAIRRGELMTRIRGCEEIADAMGMAGLFLTLTCPSRFHATKVTGDRNKKHDGSTPKDAQKWLCLNWARARASLDRAGIKCFGFRVAEPHHDGTVHWHALLWFESSMHAALARVMLRARWLSTDGTAQGDADAFERGASKYRVKCKAMERGGAAGYIAKYIAKNIDDVGIDSHLDDYADSPIGRDLMGDVEVKPCMRVEAWAATWGIRQFQAIGQPPVTVWRELRRVAPSKALDAGYGGAIHRAWGAAQGVGAGADASWSRYCKAQGGVMAGRAYVVALATELRDVEGRYGMAARACVMGVRINTPGSRCVFSERRLWRRVDSASSGLGFAVAKPLPRTRVNNCTHNRLRPRAVVAAQVERAMQSSAEKEFASILAAVRRSMDAKILANTS
jgi:Bacteriophage replication gene A protein (GPA)